jgi:hypothetical protein
MRFALAAAMLPFFTLTACQEREGGQPQDYREGALNPSDPALDPSPAIGPGTSGNTGPGGRPGEGTGTRSDYQPSTGPGGVTETQGQ